MVNKERLDEQTIAMRAAKEFQDGDVVNLGIGIPALCANYIRVGREVLFETENGALGFGSIASPEEASIYFMGAGDMPLTRQPGTSFFSVDESHGLIRGRHLDIAVLGGLQVSEKGDLANWTLPTKKLGSIGGAMDIAYGAQKVIITMLHTTKRGEYRIVKKCSYSLTAPECVRIIVTDIAVIEVTSDGLLLKEVAPGWTPDEIQALTEPKLLVADDLKEITLI